MHRGADMSTESVSFESRLAMAERQLRLMWLVCLLELVAFGVSLCVIFLTPSVAAQGSSTQVIRARGIIIEDAQGRPRILIGAPFPQVPERTRKDGQTAALVLLGENGADRLIVGEAPNPPGGGARIAPGVGVTVHDPKGRERGGFGFLGDKRAVFALDRTTGDAVGAMVNDETDFAGFIANYPTRKTGVEIGTKGQEAFVRVLDRSDKPRASLSLASDGTPSLVTYDAEGKEQLDVLRPLPKR